MALRNYILIAAAVILAFATVIMNVRKFPDIRWLRKLLKGAFIAASIISILAVILFPGFQSIKPTGPYSYATVELQLNDESRSEAYASDGSCRKLSLSVTYPTGEPVEAASCPLIVFSHGGISLKTSNTSMYEELASHGYIVVSIDHTYQAISTTIDGRKIRIDQDYMKALNTEDSNRNIADSYACYQNWMDIRTRDIEFVLDTFIFEAGTSENSFYSLIDPEKIGLAGHSLGGSAALGVARVRDDIDAVIALESPYMCDIIGYADDCFVWNTKPYDCAIMNIYSDTGYPLVGSDNKYVQNSNHLYNEGNIEYYYIKGSNHFTLTDLVRSSPILCVILGGGYAKSGPDTLTFINDKSLAFFDKYLRYWL